VSFETIWAMCSTRTSAAPLPTVRRAVATDQQADPELPRRLLVGFGQGVQPRHSKLHQPGFAHRLGGAVMDLLRNGAGKSFEHKALLSSARHGGPLLRQRHLVASLRGYPRNQTAALGLTGVSAGWALSEIFRRRSGAAGAPSRKSDEDIRRDVEVELKCDPDISADDIAVVILRGQVRSCAERRDAERAAWRAPGIREVENLITIEAWAAARLPSSRSNGRVAHMLMPTSITWVIVASAARCRALEERRGGVALLELESWDRQPTEEDRRLAIYQAAVMGQRFGFG
jgi:hypothetical protein